MSSPLKVATVFTAVNQFSSPMAKMSNDVEKFGAHASAAIHRADRAFNKLIPSISHTTKHLIEAYATFDAVQKIEQGIEFVTETFSEFDDKIGDLQSSLGLTDKAFGGMRKTLIGVADDTGKSALGITDIFKIAIKANPALKDNAESLTQVSEAAILAADAAEQAFGPATESLTTVLNKFKIPASEAKAAVDAFAAASQNGVYNISALEDGITQFGDTAKLFGADLNQSIALVQLSGAFRKAGESAGDSGAHIRKFMSTLINIRNVAPDTEALLLKNGVSMTKLRSATVPVTEKLDELAKIQKKGALLTTIFGAKNAEYVMGLIAHRKELDPLIEKTKERGAAEEMAARHEATLKNSLEKLKNAFINILVGSDDATEGVSLFAKGIRFLAENLGIVVYTVGLAVSVFLAWKAIVLTTTLIMGAFNIAIGISAAMGWSQNTAFIASAAGMAAYNTIIKIGTVYQLALNAAMTANPIGLIIVGIAALIALIAVVINKWNEWGAALSIFMGPLGLIISLIQSFRRNWDMISQAFKTGGVVAGLKAIGATILDAVIMPLQQVAKLIASFTGAQWATDAVKGFDIVRQNLGVNTKTDESGNAFKPAVAHEYGATDGGYTPPVVNPQKERQDAANSTMTETMKNIVTVDFKNLPAGAKVSGNGPDDLRPSTSSTFNFGQ